MVDPDKLQQRLESFGSKLTPDQCAEFRRILDDFASLYYDVGERFKMACIHLIPGKVETSNKTEEVKSFTPASKKKGDPIEELQQNFRNLQPEQVSQLINKLKEGQK